MAERINPKDWARVEALFAEAMARPASERASYIASRCAGDAWLCGEVQSLVSFAHTQAGATLDEIVEEAARRAGVLGHGAVGSRVGPYRLEAEIGRGGMGVVYLGVREDDDFDQRVAIKLLPGALYSDEMTWRFRNERKILASLEHPAVARFLDGGTTPEGVPYVIMEYVDGHAVDTYCDLHHLDLDARLDLFAKICEAVRYAHGRLVVHRDIKPANILVDAAGTPRLLDFGIAKLLEPDSEGLDRTATRIMTPHFASPEQVRGESVTAAADIYALGTLLYVLLTGRRPHEGAATRAELARRIVETDPPAPSAVSGDRRLSGDLDTIVLKAMRRDPAERYASVDRLLQDVAAQRASLPISAAPPTWPYRARKFVARNRTRVIAAAIAAVALVAGGVAATVGMVRARDAEADAEEEARVAAQVSDFLVGLFAEADPDNALGDEVTARTILDAGVARVDAELAGQPALQLRLKRIMGQSYAGLGDFEDAARLYVEALDLADTDESRAELSARLGGTYRQLYRFDDALAALDQAIATAAPRVDTTDAEAMATTAGLANALTSALQERGVVLMITHDSAGSISSLERALHLRETLDGPDAEATATTLTTLASSYGEFGRLPEAQQLYERSVGIYETVLDERHPSLLLAYDGLATTYARRHVFDSATAIFERILPIAREVWGPTHPRTSQTLTNLGAMSSEMGDDQAAERYLREALDAEIIRLGPDNMAVTYQLNNLAVLRQRAGDFAEAEQLWLRATEIRRQALGPDNPRTMSTLLGVANMRRQLGRLAASAEAYAEAVTVLRRDGPVGLEILRDYAEVLRGLGREAEAAAIEQERAVQETDSAVR